MVALAAVAALCLTVIVIRYDGLYFKDYSLSAQTS
jgi:hypothetical protein